MLGNKNKPVSGWRHPHDKGQGKSMCLCVTFCDPARGHDAPFYGVGGGRCHFPCRRVSLLMRLLVWMSAEVDKINKD